MDNTSSALPKVRFGEWIGEGWNMFAEQWKVWVLNSLVLSLVTVVPMIGLYILGIVAAAGSRGADSAGVGIVLVGVMFLVGILVMLLATFVSAGMYHCAFKQLRGEPISTRDLFAGGERWLPLLGASFLVGVLTFIGALLCVIPAFIVAGALYFTLPLVVDRRLGPGEAIQASRDATRGDLFTFILFAFVASLIAQAGAYACYVGLLVTMPLHYTIAVIAYRDCFGVPGARSFASKPSPYNAYGAPPASGYPPAPPQQWPGYASPEPPPAPAAYEPPVGAPLPVTAPQPPPTTGAVSHGATREVTTCPDCQAELPATARFCFRCGRNLIQA